jgi:hypothetical protein
MYRQCKYHPYLVHLITVAYHSGGTLTWSQFVGCGCTATNNTCGPHQSCDLNGCAGQFPGISVFPECTGNVSTISTIVNSQTCMQLREQPVCRLWLHCHRQYMRTASEL